MGGGFVGETGAGRLGAAATRIGAAALFMRRVPTQPRHSEWSAAKSRNLLLAGARFLDSTALRFVPPRLARGRLLEMTYQESLSPVIPSGAQRNRGISRLRGRDFSTSLRCASFRSK